MDRTTLLYNITAFLLTQRHTCPQDLCGIAVEPIYCNGAELQYQAQPMDRSGAVSGESSYVFLTLYNAFNLAMPGYNTLPNGSSQETRPHGKQVPEPMSFTVSCLTSMLYTEVFTAAL